MVDRYQTTTTKSTKVEVVKLKSPIRLIMYGGSRKSSDNSAFLYASKNVIKDYKNDLPVKSFFISQGVNQLVDLINAQAENSIQSLDIFCHGSELGLYSILNASLDSSVSYEYVQLNNLESNLYRNKLTKFSQWEIFGGASWRNLFVISDINFKKFTNESKIEIHGCNTALDGKSDTFSAELSKASFKGGKKRSIVIGHADYANPNRGGTREISKQDYRHELRIVYHNGNVIAKTKMEGRIPASFIRKSLGG